MFDFVKQIFISAMTFFSCNLPGVNTLKCLSMNSKECKVRPQVLMLIVGSLYFIHLVLKQVNAVVFLTTSMIHMQNCVFLML